MKPENTAMNRSKCGVAADLHERSGQRTFGICALLNATDCECQGDGKSACNHERQHVGNASHQVLVRAGSRLRSIGFGLFDRPGKPCPTLVASSDRLPPALS